MPHDILLLLPVHPDPLPARALDAALDAAALLCGHVTGVACVPELALPFSFRPYPEAFLSHHAERQKALEQSARDQVAAFEEAARQRGLACEGRIEQIPAGDSGGAIVELARLRNLTLLPHLAGDEAWTELMQAVIFGSGRPALILPPDAELRLDSVAVAWDFSRAASRAVEDALPILRKAGEVRAIVVTHEKWLPDNPSGPEFAKHLARNGVTIVLEEIQLGFLTVGETIEQATSGAGLLVMGAYGHSRLRDFLLGGATRHLLADPKLPVLVSY